MIVYRDEKRVRDTTSLVRALRQPGVGRDDLLIGFGELEAGVVDADSGAAPLFRRAAETLGRAWISGAWDDFHSAFARAVSLPLPRTIRVPVSEGYAFYALYPEMYVESAGRFFEECRPGRVCVIGIRSIGTSLSAIVAGALASLGCEVQSFTVRPHGHPFDRRSELPAGIDRNVDFFAIVDEGPGLSGSSFISVAELFPLDRVVLFPSWEGDAGAFVNERACVLWPRLRKYWTEFRAPCGGAIDLSGGKWREVFGVEAEVCPQHEARKYLVGDRLYKFEGLGDYGRARFSRACALGDAGFSPRALGLERGFAAFELVCGTEVPRGLKPTLQGLAEYLAFRRLSFPAERSLGFDEIAEMIECNSGAQADLSVRSEFEDRPACYVDGRMLPNEWIFDGRRWLKTDSVDHSSNHFYPGATDIAWDLAGAAIEFNMGADQRDALLSRYEEASGDRVSPPLMCFYEKAYRAFRLGYAALATKKEVQVNA